LIDPSSTPIANGSGTDVRLAVPDEANVGSWNGSFACSDPIDRGLPFTLEIIVVPPNHPPVFGVATPGLSSNVDVSENTTTSFSAVFDDENLAALSFKWILDGVPIARAEENATNIYLGFDAAGTHMVSLVVTDDGGLSTTIAWTVAVSNVDRAPVCGIVARGNLTAPPGTNVSFSSGSVDPDGDSLFYLWTSNGSLVSREANAEATVAPGTVVIGLRVTAGAASSQCSLVIESTDAVVPPAGGGGEPVAGGIDPVAAGLLVALSAAGIGIALFWWRRRK
jgi:hypothetical protein